MNYEFIENLVFSAAIVLAFCILYGLFYDNLQRKPAVINIVFGLVAGLFGLVLLFSSKQVDYYYLLDARSVLISITALFFGPLSAAIAVVILSIARLLIGGMGAWTGVLTMVVAAAAGLIWHWKRFSRVNSKNKGIYLDIYLFGWLTHLLVLVCLFTLPLDIAYNLINTISWPLLVIYPFTTLLGSAVLISFTRRSRVEAELRDSEMRFRRLYENAPIGVFVESDQEILYCNQYFEKLLGRSREEVIEQGWTNFIHADDLDNDLENYQALRSGKINEYKVNKRLYKPDGSLIWVNMIFASLKTDDFASKNEFICLLQQITDLEEARAQLEASIKIYFDLYREYKNKLSLLQSLLDNTPDWIYYKDTAGAYLGCNRAYEIFIGRNEQEIIGRRSIDIVGKDISQDAISTDLKVMRENSPLKFERCVTYPDGREAVVETVKMPYYDDQRKIQGVICVARDITEHKKREQEILYLSYHDTLTGLYNRTFYEKNKGRLEAENVMPLSLIVCDVNGLKFINDAFGHSAGDQLLVEIADLLRSCCSEQYITARVGGDEFSILLPWVDENQSKMLFEKIMSQCEEHANHPDSMLRYTNISVGFASKDDMDMSLNDVFKVAEENMYRRKMLSRNGGTHSSLLNSIKTTLYEKSNETKEHGDRMALLAKKLGQILDLPYRDIDNLELASALHDIGKISVDLSILKKHGKLSKSEWDKIKKHPEVGYRIAQAVPELRQISEIILCHHERWDGTGYPRGLAGEEIPMLARIITLVDSYDAMTDNRGYARVLSKQEAIDEIKNGAGSQYDPKIAELFVNQVLLKEEDPNCQILKAEA